MDEQTSEIGITTSADPEQFRLTAGRMLPRDQTQPGSKVASLDERRSVTDGSHRRSGYERADSRHLPQSLACGVLSRDPRDLATHDFDLLF